MPHFVCHSSDEEGVMPLLGRVNTNASSSLDLEGQRDEVSFENTSEDADGIVDAWKANDHRVPSRSSSESRPPVSTREDGDDERQRKTTTTTTKRDERHVTSIHFHLNLFCHRLRSRRFDCEPTLAGRSREEVRRCSSRRRISSLSFHSNRSMKSTVRLLIFACSSVNVESWNCRLGTSPVLRKICSGRELCSERMYSIT